MGRHLLRIVARALIGAALLVSAPAYAWKMEAATVTIQATSGASPAFTHASFRQTYPTAPLVFVLTTNQGSDPGAVRIRNVTTGGFELTVMEPKPNDGPHAVMTVSYLAIEPGDYTIGGVRLNAGSVNTNEYQGAHGSSSPGWKNVTDTVPGTSAILAQIQTMRNETGSPGHPSVPWMTAVVQKVAGGSFKLALERGEADHDGGSVSQAEQIAYLAIEGGKSGNFTDIFGSTIDLETLIPGDVVRGWSDGCFHVAFSPSYSSAPVALATVNSRNDNAGGWLRQCSLGSSQIGLAVDEAVSRSATRSHSAEAPGIVAFSQAFTYDSTVTVSAPSLTQSWKMEAGQLDMPASPAWQAVSFNQTYAAPPLVFATTGAAIGISNYKNSVPADVRIRNITTTGFEIAQVSPPHGASSYPYAPVRVHYVVVEPGIHTLPDGTLLEAWQRPVIAVQHGSGPSGSTSWQSLSFNAGFAATPAVLTQIETMANEPAHVAGTPSVPWLTTATQSVSKSGMQVALERSEVNDGSVSKPETVAYLAIQAGKSGSFADIDGNTVGYESQLTADKVTGWDNGCGAFSYLGSGYSSPLVIGSKNTRDGGDGGWLRRCGVPTASNFYLDVEEDQDHDSERSHTTERAGVLIFAQPFAAWFGRIAGYHLDESGWSGAPGEVKDSSGNNYNGEAKNGASTAGASPAIAGSPGTCRYGAFDGTQYVEIPGFPNLTDDFTITAWIRTTNRNRAGQRVFQDDQHNTGGYSVSLGDGGAGRVRFYARGTSPVSLDSPAVVQNDTWYFVAAVADITNHVKRLYVYDSAGTLLGGLPVSQGISGSWGTDSGPATIGGEPAGGEVNNRFHGNLDEVQVFHGAMTEGEIESIMAQTHPCAQPVVDHIRLVHDGAGITCAAETVTVQACTAAAPGCLPLATTPVSATLTSPSSGWSPSSTVSFTGSTDLTLQNTAGGNVTLDATSADTSNPTTCYDTSDGSTSCTLNFASAGFVFDVPNATAGQTATGVTISAVKADPADPATCGPAFSGSKTVDFSATYLDPASAPSGGPLGVALHANAGGDYSVTPASVPGGAAQGVTLNFNSAGQATFDLTYLDAGKMQLNATYTGSAATSDAGLVLTGSDDWISKPYALCVYSPDANADCSPASATCSVFRKAGETFTLSAKGVAWVSGNPTAPATTDASACSNPTTPNLQLAGIGLSPQLVAPGGGHNTSLSATSVDIASSGEGSVSQAVNEVGVFAVKATPPAYQGQTLPTATSANIGRFIPDHFDVEVTHGCVDAASVGSMTYSEQPFTAKVYARNGAGATTLNYDGALGFAKQTSLGDASMPTATWLDNFSNNVIPADDTGFVQGVAVDNQLTYTFPARETAPYTLKVRAEDTDSVSSAGQLEQSTEIRGGRLQLTSAFGSELLPLNMPVAAQYWNGSAFVTNTADVCTALKPLPPGPVDQYIALSDYSGALNSGNVSVSAVSFSSGAGNITLSPPGAGKQGTVKVTVNLDSIAPVPVWLKYDWSGGGTLANPSALATFGVYGGSGRQIYQREQY